MVLVLVLTACAVVASPVGSGMRCGSGVVSVHRLVAVADIHGDAAKFRQVLTRAGVAEFYQEDSEGGGAMLRARWTPSSAVPVGLPPSLSCEAGGPVPLRTTLVQLGDLVDRGAEDMEVLHIALDLKESAAAAAKNSGDDEDDDDGNNDTVELLIGNHELMNLQGDFRYVHQQDYSQFSSLRARRDAFQPNGAFGRAIIEKFSTMFLSEGTLFVHAGFDEDYAGVRYGAASLRLPPAETNEAVREALRRQQFRVPLLGSRGPLWTRALAHDAMRGRCEWINEVLREYKAERIVVGHTPRREGRSGVYCAGAVVEADVGLSRWMFDHFAALEILAITYDDGRRETVVVELRENGHVPLWPPPSAKSSRRNGHGGGTDAGDL